MFVGSVRSSRHREMDSLASQSSQVVTPQRQFCTPVERDNDQPAVPITRDVNRTAHRYNVAEFVAGSSRRDHVVADSSRMFEAVDRLPFNGTDMTTRMSEDDYHTCSPDSAYHSSHDSGSIAVWNDRQGFNGQLTHHHWWSPVTHEPMYTKNHEKHPSWPVTQPSVLPSTISNRTSSWTDNARLSNTDYNNQKPVNSQVRDSSPPSPHTARRYFEELAAQLREEQACGEFQPHNTRVQPSSNTVGQQNNIENNAINYFSPDYVKTVAERARFSHSPGDLECSPAPPPLPATSPPHDPPPRLSSSGTLSASSGVEKVTTPYTAELHRDVSDTKRDRQLLDSRGMLGTRAVPSITQVRSLPETSVNGTPSQREQMYLVNTRRCIYENASGSLTPLAAEGCHLSDNLSPCVTIEEDDLNARLDQLPRSRSQTSVLRRLSQEYFGDSRSRYGINPTGRMSLGSFSSALSTSGNDLSQPAPTKSVETNYRCQESESPKETVGPSVFGAVEPTDDAGTNFIRTRKTQMSLRKAFGIFDDFDAAEAELVKHLPVLAEDDVSSASVPSCALNNSVGLAACENHKVNWNKGRRSSESEFLRQASDWRNFDRQAERPSVDSSSVLHRSISVGSGGQPAMCAVLHGRRLSTASDVQSIQSSSSGSTNGVRSSQDVLTGNSACATDVMPVSGLLVKESNGLLKAAVAKSKSLPRGALLPSDADLALSFPQQRHHIDGVDRLEVNHTCFRFLLLLFLYDTVTIYYYCALKN